MFVALVDNENATGLLVRVVSADITEDVLVPSTSLLADYGFNTWIHFVFTYEYGSSIDLYLNGVVHSNTVKSSSPGSGVDSPFGTLIIGNTYIGQSNGYEAFMMLDELIIWEEWIDADDVMRLYQAYQ